MAAAAPVEPPPAGAVGTCAQFVCVQSCHLGDPGRQLRRPVAGSRRLAISPASCRAAARSALASAASTSASPSSRSRPASIRTSSAQLTVALSPENEIGVEEAFFRTHVAAGGIHRQGRPVLLGLRLPERDPRARLGLRRPAARLPGVLRLASTRQDGVQVKWLAPTDLFLEFGAETGNGDAFPGTRLRAQRPERRRRSSPTWAATSATPSAGAPGCRGSTWMPRIAPTRTSTASASAVVNAFTGSSRDLDRRCDAEVDADRRCHAPPAQAAGRVHASAPRTATLAFDVDGVRPARRRYRSRPVRLVRAGRLPVPAALARRAALRRRSTRASTRIGLVQHGDAAGDGFPAAAAGHAKPRHARMFDWSPSEFSRLRAQYAWDDARDADTDRAVLPAVHLCDRRPWRPQVLGDDHESIHQAACAWH